MVVNKGLIIFRAMWVAIGIICVFIGLGILPFVAICRYVKIILTGTQEHWLGIAGNVTVLFLTIGCALFVCAAAGLLVVESLKLLSLKVSLSSEGIAFRTDGNGYTLAWKHVLHIIRKPFILTIIFYLDGEIRILNVPRSLFGESGFEELTDSIRAYAPVIEEPGEKHRLREQYRLQNVFNKRKVRLTTILN